MESCANTQRALSEFPDHSIRRARSKKRRSRSRVSIAALSRPCSRGLVARRLVYLGLSRVLYGFIRVFDRTSSRILRACVRRRPAPGPRSARASPRLSRDRTAVSQDILKAKKGFMRLSLRPFTLCLSRESSSRKDERRVAQAHVSRSVSHTVCGLTGLLPRGRRQWGLADNVCGRVAALFAALAPWALLSAGRDGRDGRSDAPEPRAHLVGAGVVDGDLPLEGVDV